MAHVSDIKLIRTDTTLDLSQKAEKGMYCQLSPLQFYSLLARSLSFIYPMWEYATQDFIGLK